METYYTVRNKKGRAMFEASSQKAAENYYRSMPSANLIEMVNACGDVLEILQPNVANTMHSKGVQLRQVFRHFTGRNTAFKRAADLRAVGYLVRCIKYLHGYQIFAAKIQS